MLRSVSLLAMAVGLGLASPVLAADWEWVEGESADFREPMGMEPKDWTDLGDESDSVGFEFGLRYSYSLGGSQYSSDGDTFSSTDKTHSVEAHARVDDAVTQTFLKGHVGYSFASDGEYNNDGITGPITDGTIGYGTIDLGYNMLGEGPVGFGPLVGYQYYRDGLNTGRRNFTTVSPGDQVAYDPVTGDILGLPGDSEQNDITVHALRLGLQTKADFNSLIDISAEVAAIPYANINGTLGIDGIATTKVGEITTAQSAATEISGWGYGAAGEVMVGFRPAENVVFRVGGRAWYLQGQADTRIETVRVQDAVDVDPVTPGFETPAQVISQQSFISTANPFSMFRYGVLAELTYKF